MKLSKGNRNICIQKLNNEQREMLGENRAVAYNYKWLLRRQLRTKTCIRIDECVVAVVFIQNTPMIWWVDICCLNDNWRRKAWVVDTWFYIIYLSMRLYSLLPFWSRTIISLRKLNGLTMERYSWGMPMIYCALIDVWLSTIDINHKL